MDLIKKLECAVIFFESPLRILKTLNFINDHYGSCEITLVRELTKKNEEVINSNITEVIEKLRNRKKILGEITFVVKPFCHSKENKISNEETSNSTSPVGICLLIVPSGLLLIFPSTDRTNSDLHLSAIEKNSLFSGSTTTCVMPVSSLKSIKITPP